MCHSLDACSSVLIEGSRAIFPSQNSSRQRRIVTMIAYLQRVDDFIQLQIYKFEQKKRGKEYYEVRRANGCKQRPTQHPVRAQTLDSPTTPGLRLPDGWIRSVDQNAQRWYYINQATGRAQWNPPSGSSSPSSSSGRSNTYHHTLSGDYPGPTRSSNHFDGDTQRALRHQEEEDMRMRGLANADSRQHPGNSDYLGSPPRSRPASSISPHASPTGMLPPGTFLDMTTGQVVGNMYPPDHSINAQ
jgi:hypothetical protein